MDCDFSPSSPHLLPNGLFSPQNRISFELLALSGLSGFSTFEGGKMLIFQWFANSRIVREFPPFSFKVRIATLTRNQFVGNHTRVRIPPAAPYKQRSKFGSQKRGRQMPASFLCHKHSTKASFHGLSSFTKRITQKEKTENPSAQMAAKPFLNPEASFSTAIFFCSVYRKGQAFVMACHCCNMYAGAGFCPNSGRKPAFQRRMPQPQISVDFAGECGYNQVGKL